MKRIIVFMSVLALAVALVWAGDKETAEQPDKPEKAEEVQKVEKDTAKAKSEEPDWIVTETGLKYVDLVVGEGDEIIAGSNVKMHYTLWLVGDDGKKGKKIQSSKDTNQPFTTSIPGRLIAAWNEGIPGMKVGGTRLLLSPPELAYGSQGMGAMIPPNSTLFFEVECLEIVK